jgi:enamine deaminase RidA (YjgF/YER057c/UK114 family)
MSETIEKRLSDLGVTLPAAAAPAANYVPYCQTGNLLFTAGQLPLKDGKLQAIGLLGRDVDTATGKEAAKYCAINILAQAKAALGDLGKIRRLVKITVFVASARLCRAASGRQRRLRFSRRSPWRQRQTCPLRGRHGLAAA